MLEDSEMQVDSEMREAPVINKNKRHRKEKRGSFSISLRLRLIFKSSLGHGRH